MNLHAIVGPAIAAINPMTIGSLAVSTGSTIAPGGRQTPTYQIFTGVQMQVQAFTARELQHVDHLNLQGLVRGVYMNGDIEGLERFAGKGGDVLLFTNPQTGLTGAWLVEEVMETWDQDGWCRVIVTLQNSIGPFIPALDFSLTGGSSQSALIGAV